VPFALCIHGVQPATHILDLNAEARKRIGFESDVTKLDDTGLSRANETAMLPRDAGITDRTFGIVPDHEFWTRSWAH
jgi:hypothetical protein